MSEFEFDFSEIPQSVDIDVAVAMEEFPGILEPSGIDLNCTHQEYNDWENGVYDDPADLPPTPKEKTQSKPDPKGVLQQKAVEGYIPPPSTVEEYRDAQRWHETCALQVHRLELSLKEARANAREAIKNLATLSAVLGHDVPAFVEQNIKGQRDAVIESDGDGCSTVGKDNTWKEVEVEALPLDDSVIGLLHGADIFTCGDMAEASNKNNGLTYIKGIGPETEADISDAFNKAWNDG